MRIMTNCWLNRGMTRIMNGILKMAEKIMFTLWNQVDLMGWYLSWSNPGSLDNRLWCFNDGNDVRGQCIKED